MRGGELQHQGDAHQPGATLLSSAVPADVHMMAAGPPHYGFGSTAKALAKRKLKY